MQENKNTIEDLYKYFKAGDGEKIAALFHPEIEWQQMDGFPNGGKYVGVKEIFKEVFGQFPKQWKGWGAVPEEFVSVDNLVFVLGYYKGKSIEKEIYMEAPMVHVYTLENGLITHFRQYTDTHIVQSALGQ